MSASFLPGVVRKPGFRRKTFWCSSHTPMIIHNSTGMLQRPRAAWDVALARLTARDTFSDATLSKNNQTTSFKAVNNWSSAMFVHKGHKREWAPVFCVPWPFTKLCCYTVLASSLGLFPTMFSLVFASIHNWHSLNNLLLFSQIVLFWRGFLSLLQWTLMVEFPDMSRLPSWFKDFNKIFVLEFHFSMHMLTLGAYLSIW